tara:strand:+ start:803 stop:1018 length:216 start_codon:yes stop_codon:yes gene_type:complete
VKCKSCDRLLLDDDDIELCRKCLKQDNHFYDNDGEDQIDSYEDDDEDDMLDIQIEIESYTEITESDYLLME